MSEGRIDILVIDDDPWIVELVMMAAEERGWNVQSASDGITGLEMLEQLRPRVVLLDVRLPKQDGWAVLGQMEREWPGHPPVIMMTANRLEEDLAVPGAAEILRKPFHLAPFLDLIAEYMKAQEPSAPEPPQA